MKAILVLVLFAAVFAGAQQFTNDLQNIDFSNIIGAPLTAVVQAQATASKTTTDFINDVGFITGTNGAKSVRLVSFSYARVDNDTLRNFTLSIPFILMIPVPYIEISDIEITFNVQLNSVDTSQSSASFNYAASEGVAYNWGSGYVNYQAGVSYKSMNQNTGQVQQQYSLSVKVVAGQSDLPAGAVKIFDILESTIHEISD